MIAAMPAMRRPYSTAEAPRSSGLVKSLRSDVMGGVLRMCVGPWPPRAGGQGPNMRCDQLVQVAVMLVLPLSIALQVSLKASLMIGPSANTAMTIRAAMPAISRPYSTADAPRSSRFGLEQALEVVDHLGGSLSLG